MQCKKHKNENGPIRAALGNSAAAAAVKMKAVSGILEIDGCSNSQ